MSRQRPPDRPAPEGRTTPAITEELCLMGPRHLDELLEQVASYSVAGPVPSRADVTALWRQGVSEYQRLAQSEAGAADMPTIRPLPKSMARHIERLVEQEGVRRTFDTVPVAFGLVELDTLVISQYSMTQAVVDHIVSAHPLPLSPSKLVELCLPQKPIAADFRLAGQTDREFTFVSDAHDMRFLDAQVLSPVQVQQAPVMGHPGAVLALSVGFSSNLLNVVRYNGRLALNNGHHRAHALKALGFTHVPCLIQPCASVSDLEQAGTREICANADLYFDAPRPPLLRDFANPLLAHAFQAPRMRRVLTLKLDVQRRLLAL